MDNISATEAAKLLGVSVEGLKSLESQGLLHKPYTAFEINKIKSPPGLTLADEAAIVNAQIEQEVVVSVSGLMSFRKKAALLTAGTLLILILLTIVLALLFNFYPLQTSDFFGYYFRYNAAGKQASLPNKTGGKVLAAATGPGVAIPQTSVLADIIKPLAAASLVAVKAVDNQKYAQIVTNPVEAAGLAAPSDTPGPPGQSGASGTEGPPGLTGLAGPTGPAGTAGSNGSSGSSVADVMTAIGDLIIRNSSNTTAKLAAGTNAQVLTISGGLPIWADPAGGSAFSSITGGTNTTAALVVGSGASLDFLGTGSINASTLNGINFGTISNDATINSTGVLTLKSVGTAGTYGSGSLIPVLTTDTQGRVSGVTNTAISGLTNSNLSGSAGITNANLANSSLTVTAGTGLSGGGLVSLGGSTMLSLPSIGTAGTYGSALNIPVLTTDAQGRVTGMTNTAIAGLTVSNFSSANISQWTNNSGYLTSEADTLASVTGRGATTTTAVTLQNLTSTGETNIATGSGNVTVGNATGTFALTSSGGLNVSTAGALTGVASVTGTTGLTITGGTASGNNLTLSSTSNATKGKLLFGTSGYDEVNNRLGIRTTFPNTDIQIGPLSNTNANSVLIGGVAGPGYMINTTGTNYAMMYTNGDNILNFGFNTSIAAPTTSVLTLLQTGANISGSLRSSGATDLATVSGNVAIGNSAGTFSLTSNGGLNVTTAGALTGATYNGLTINTSTGTLALTNAKTLTVSNSLTFTGTDGTSFAFPATSDDVVGRTVAQTLTNKTIAAGSNTISGLTNSNLSGTAAISNANLANSALTVSAGSGLTDGGSVSLGGSTTVNVNLTTSGTTGSTSSNSGLEVSSSGLTLLKGCTDNEILKWTDAGGWACAADSSGGSPVLSAIAAASGGNSINNSDNAQVWNWALTTASKTAFTFGENSASTNGAGSQYILGLSTLASSTAAPLKVSAQGNTIIDTTSTGGMTFGNTTANTAITLQSGTGAINIGTDANAKAITIGNTTGATALNLDAGSGNINLNSQLVLDSQSADPTGVNGGIYYNTTTGKFRCFQSGAWANCITPPGSDLQSAASYKTNDTLINVGAAQVTLTSVSVTPSTATGDVYVRAKAEILSSNNTDQSLILSIEDNATCTGSTLETNTISITVATGIVVGDFEIADVEVDAGTSSQSYSLCASTATGDSDIRLYEMFATVIDTGADLAEVYTTSDDSLSAGDVVSIDPSLKAGMKKSETPYDRNVLGIVSSRPGLIIGSVEKEGTKAMPVALSGRVPVKVSKVNGPIEIGDLLTSSSLPGVAMKATAEGAIIGTAMTPFDGESVGQVLVFVKNGSSMGSGFSDAHAASNSARFAQPESEILKIIADLFKNAVEFFGHAIFHGDVDFLGRPTFNKDTAGHAQILKAATEVEVKFDKEYETNPVVTANVNLSGDEEIPEYAVFDVTTKGFKIKLTKPATFDLTFSWIALAVNAKSQTIKSSPTPVETISTPTPAPALEPDLEASPSGLASPSGSITM